MHAGLMSSAPAAIVVMGVSGTGKTTVGSLLAQRLDAVFVEGDDHHPEANVRKMADGAPLTDADRRPWLQELGDVLARERTRGRAVVMSCSALKRSYRDVLREAAPDAFVLHLHADRDVLAQRLGERTGHFMPADLLDSQLSTLEPLQPDELGALIDVTPPPDEVAAAAYAALRR